MRILITGAQGQLGHALQVVVHSGFQVGGFQVGVLAIHQLVLFQHLYLLLVYLFHVVLFLYLPGQFVQLFLQAAYILLFLLLGQVVYLLVYEGGTFEEFALTVQIFFIYSE